MTAETNWRALRRQWSKAELEAEEAALWHRVSEMLAAGLVTICKPGRPFRLLWRKQVQRGRMATD